MCFGISQNGTTRSCISNIEVTKVGGAEVFLPRVNSIIEIMRHFLRKASICIGKARS